MAEERATGRNVRPEVDPWLTEARLVAAHESLHKRQLQERAFLAAAFKRVRMLEARRMTAIRSAIEAFLQTYKQVPVSLTWLKHLPLSYAWLKQVPVCFRGSNKCLCLLHGSSICLCPLQGSSKCLCPCNG